MPPHFTSFTLIPSTQPNSAGRSLASLESSSVTIGIGERSRIQRSFSGEPAGIGCSQNSMSCLPSSASTFTARSGVQPSFASMRIVPAYTARIASIVSTSAPLPSLTLITGCVPTSRTFASVSPSGAMPIVNDVSGVRAESSPNSRHSGRSRSLPTRSCRAMSRPHICAGVSPARSRSNAYGSSPRSSAVNPAVTLSTLSP